MDPDATLEGLEGTVASDGRRRLRPGALQPGERLGRYVLDRQVGRGAMGVVYAARDPDLSREVALKVVLAEDARRRDAVLAEAQAMARLNHHNVITVYDVGVAEPFAYIAMELVTGRTLHQFQTDNGDWRAVLEVYIDAANGIAAAHDAGLVHGDFKAENVLVDGSRVLVTDFGLAVALAEDEPSTSAPSKETATKTRRGPAGTLNYMAPEVMNGDLPAPASDQFSFCVSLHEALYGQRPFCGKTLGELVGAIHAREIASAPLRRPIPRSVRATLMRGLQPLPDQRWPSMHAVRDQLTRTGKRRHRFAISLAGGTAVVAGVAISLPADVDDARRGCMEGAEPLAEVWNDDVRMRLREQFASVPHGRDRLEHIDVHLRKWTEEWTETHHVVCGRLDKADGFDGSMQCLAARRAALESTLTLLIERGRDGSVHAMQALEALPRAAGRLDAGSPESTGSVEVVLLEAELQQVRALLAIMDAPAALSAAGRLATKTESDDVPARLQAHAQLELGRALRYSKLEHASFGFERAHEIAAANGLHSIAFSAAVERAELEGERGSTAAAKRWLEQARAVLPRVDASERPRSEIAITTAEAGIASAQGDLQLARRKYEQAIAAAEELFSEGPRLGLLTRYARTLHGMAEYEKAQAITGRGLQRCVPLHSQTYAPCLDLMNVHGAVAQSQGDLDKAEETFFQIVESLEESGSQNVKLAAPYNNLALIAKMRGDFDRALELQTRATKLLEAERGSEDPGFLVSLLNVGSLQIDTGHLAQAIDTYSRARTLAEAALGADDMTVAIALHGLSQCRSRRGEHEEALRLARHSLAIRQKAVGSNHPGLAYPLGEIGGSLISLGRPAEAAAPLRRARAILQRHGAEPKLAVQTAARLAQALVLAGEDGEEVDALVDEVARSVDTDDNSIITDDLRSRLAEIRALRRAPKRH